MGRISTPLRLSWIIFAIACPFTAHAYELVDRIAAVVDGSVVLHSVIKRKMDNGPLVLVSDYPAGPKGTEYERALQDSINLQLIVDAAEEIDIVITEDELEEQVQALLSERGANKQALLQFLKQQGTTYDEYKNDFRDQMLIRRFQGRVILPQVKLTERDLETYFLKKQGATSDAVSLDLRQILIKVGDSSGPLYDEKKSLAETVHQKVSSGLAFEEAVKVYSDGPNARINGGLMKNIKLNDLAPAIKGSLVDLNEGDFTQPVKTPLGFHIFFLDKKSLVNSGAFASQKKNLEFELRQQEINRQTRAWIEKARKENKIDIVHAKLAG